MSQLNVLFTPDFGEKIFVRRVFLDSAVEKETLLVLTSLLNHCPMTTSKKELSRLRGGKMTFQSYRYGSGYVLEGRLSLVETKNFTMTYLFMDPEKEALAIFNDAFTLGFKAEENEVSLAKERILSTYQKEEMESLSLIKKDIGIYPASLSCNEVKLQSITLSHVQALFEKVKASNTGDCLYLGKEEKQNPLALLPSFEKELPAFSYEKEVQEKDSVTDETTALYLDIKRIENEENYLCTKIALEAYLKAFEEYFKKYIGFDISYSYEILDNQKAVVFFTTLRGKRETLSEKIPSSLDAKAFVEEALLDSKVDAVKNCMSSAQTLFEMEKRIALGLDNNTKIIQENQFKAEDILPILSAIQFCVKEEA